MDKVKHGGEDIVKDFWNTPEDLLCSLCGPEIL